MDVQQLQILKDGILLYIMTIQLNALRLLQLLAIVIKKEFFWLILVVKNVANSSNSGSLLPFQGKYYNFALKSQILSLQLYEFCAFF